MALFRNNTVITIGGREILTANLKILYSAVNIASRYSRFWDSLASNNPYQVPAGFNLRVLGALIVNRSAGALSQGFEYANTSITTDSSSPPTGEVFHAPSPNFFEFIPANGRVQMALDWLIPENKYPAWYSTQQGTVQIFCILEAN